MNTKLIFFGVIIFLIQARQTVGLDGDNSTAIIDESMLDSKKSTELNYDVILSTGINSFVQYTDFRILVSVSSEIFVYRTLHETFLEYRFSDRFKAHNSSIYAIHVLRNGAFATGSADRTIKIWLVPFISALIQIINNAHTSSINCLLELEYNSTYVLASGSSDTTIKIWNQKTGELIRTLVGHTDTVTSLLYMSENKTLFSSSADSTIRIWNYYTGDLVRILIGHTGSVSAMLFFNLYPGILISASSDETIRFWNSSTGALLDTKNGIHSAPINSLIYCGSNLLSGSSDGKIKVWKAKLLNYYYSSNFISKVNLYLRKTISDKNETSLYKLHSLSNSYQIFMAMYGGKVVTWKLNKSNSYWLTSLYVLISIIAIAFIIRICMIFYEYWRS